MPAHNAQYYGIVNNHWRSGLRPAPVCTGTETGFLVSTSCYHGYGRVPQPLTPASNHQPMEIDSEASVVPLHPPPGLTRKRSGDDTEAPRVKRLREEVHKENIEQVQIEKKKTAERERSHELEILLWGTHGACWFQLQGGGDEP